MVDKRKKIRIQLRVDHDVTRQLLRSDIIDWVMFQEILYTKQIDEVLTFVYNEYDEEYVNMIPDLNQFVEMLFKTKLAAHCVLGTPYSNPRIVALFDTVVVVEVLYNQSFEIVDK